MVKHTQTVCRQEPTNCLSVFNHFVGLTLKRLSEFICCRIACTSGLGTYVHFCLAVSKHAFEQPLHFIKRLLLYGGKTYDDQKDKVEFQEDYRN